jgi:ribosomal protein S12 methylthiotransferase
VRGWAVTCTIRAVSKKKTQRKAKKKAAPAPDGLSRDKRKRRRQKRRSAQQAPRPKPASLDIEEQVDQPVVYMVSLGCAKNQVDSERLAGALVAEGFLLAADPSMADLALVNTCAFLESARQETRQVLAEMQDYKSHGLMRAVLAAGCYPSLEGKIPGADRTIKFKDYAKLAQICRAALKLPKAETQAPAPCVMSTSPRLRFGQPATAYLKISEGCSNVCSYCMIPGIRGKMQSRPEDEIFAEAQELVADGARELILIAQDTAAYGTDSAERKPRLAALMKRLLKIKDFRWLRLMYAHPGHITPELLELFNEERVADYLDMPVQHAHPRILSAMNRNYTSRDVMDIVEEIRRRSPKTALRTTVMVGFPGEKSADLDHLKALLIDGEFDHVGAFAYSPEKGTSAESMTDQVSERTKKKRLREILSLQKLISAGRSMQRIGDQIQVLVEEVPYLPGTAYGRSQYQAPEVDARVILTRPHAALATLAPGQFVEAVVTSISGPDLVARLLPKQS